MIVGWICIGFGFGIIASALLWWNAGYRAGYHDGVADTGAMLGGLDVTGW